MTNKTKIILAILIILAIAVAIFGIASSNKSENNTNKKQDEISEMMNYIDDTDKKDNQINKIETNNTVLNENTVSNENEIANEVNNNAVIGKEEQESNIENTEFDNKQKAIEMAKKEWGISVDSYKFEAELQSDGTYIVKVINKTDTKENARYIVNVTTETIEEV